MKLLCQTLGLLLLLPVVGLGQTDTTTDAHEEARQRILEIARAYAEHEWKATEANVQHGPDAQGNHVDTPDISFREDGFHADGRVNVGVPYMWGGFSSLEQFDQGIANGSFAGHLPKSGASPSSAQAVGVDCSGYVSRCWDLPMKQSTRSLGNVSYVLDGFDELLPGDAVNSFDGHVVIFKEWIDDGQMSVYEAAFPNVKESTYSLELLEEKNYVPLRFKPLDPRWVPMDLASETTTLESTGKPAFTASDEEVVLDDLWNPLDDAMIGEWTRYAAGRDMLDTRAVMGETEDDYVLLQFLTTIDGSDLPTDARSDRSGPLIDLLVDFAGYPMHLGELEVEDSAVTAGQYQLGDHEFDAHKIDVTVRTALLSRGIHYPVTIGIEAFLSDDVPVEGLLEVTYDLRIDYGQGRVGENRHTARLVSFHDPTDVAGG